MVKHAQVFTIICDFLKDTVFLYRQKDGKAIKESARLKIEIDEATGRVALVIKEAKAEDAGKYKLTAENEAGSVNTEAKASVKGNFPKIDRAKHHFVSQSDAGNTVITRSEE